MTEVCSRLIKELHADLLRQSAVARATQRNLDELRGKIKQWADELEEPGANVTAIVREMREEDTP